MTEEDRYAERVRAWAAELRSGSTVTWADFAGSSSAPAPGAAGPLPGAAQLELVRRLAGCEDLAGLPDFGGLADLVLGTAGPGRGLVDVPLPWGDQADAAIGTPPVAPDELPAEELLRVCAGVLVRLLATEPAVPPGPSSRRWRPWRRGFTLLGAPTTVDLVRGALLDRGLREGGSRTTYLVLGGPLEELMAQRWAARVRAGAGLRWQRMWRAAATNDRVPPGIALPTIATHLATEFDAARVHVVIGEDAQDTLALVAEVLGVAPGPLTHRYDALATDLLRRVNPVLTLAVGEEARREIVARVWPEIAAGEDPGPLGAPARQLEWAIRTGERMATAVAGGRYSVHGDPALVVPTRRPGVRRVPDPDAVLAHALRVVGRAWRRHVAGTDAAKGRG
ncbi:MAG TPA: hypothetical protein VHO29_13210 [Marmoricola sp.]|nr:hypothetical protein [Marmoricola sp.]